MGNQKEVIGKEKRRKAISLVIYALKGNLSVDEFSLKIDCDRSSGYRILSGKTALSFPVFLNICEAYKISPNEFLEMVERELKKLNHET